jgi:hypothetical protein
MKGKALMEPNLISRQALGREIRIWSRIKMRKMRRSQMRITSRTR